MPLTLPPPLPTREEGLNRRLDQISARLRRVVAARAGSWLVVVTVVFLGGLAVFDSRFQFPGLVRALGLVTYLAAIPVLAWRWIVRPLAGAGDRQAIAGRVERAYPEFNDSLVSAVEFLQREPDDRATSVAFRKLAIGRAARKAERYEFDRAVNARGLKRSAFAALLAILVAGGAAYWAPSAAAAAARRIFLPFGGGTVPTRTQIEILAPRPLPHRMARGEPLDLKVGISGDVPDRVTVSIRLDGSPVVEQSYAVTPPEDPTRGTELTVRIEPTRIPRDFKFRVRANDANTGWQSVQVAPPPVLIPLDGRPSPQLRLDFPRYTDLAPVDLPDGSGVIEGVAGTRVTLRAATDRPVARAYLGYRPEQPIARWTAALCPLGAASELAGAGFGLLARGVWDDVPVSTGFDGNLLEVTFVPRLSGPYALRFEDSTGLGTTRMFDVRVFPDPAPVVTLDRPAAGRDSLLVLPDAELTFVARVQDKQYAIRSVRVEYRVGPEGPSQEIPWYDATIAGTTIPTTAGLMRGPIPAPPMPPLRLRPQELTFNERISLTRFRRTDGAPLKAGDTVTVRVVADDFDDVTGFKAPGRSHEIELVIGTRPDLEGVEEQAQADIHEELKRLLAQQREARTRVQEVIREVRNTGTLRPEDRDRLSQAELTQQQVQNRINNPEDGLRALLARLRQAAKDNHMPRSATTDRLDDAANELERLVVEELEPLETDLAAARRPTTVKEQPAVPLARAERRQKEVEQTLTALLERLEPWSGAAGIRGDARSILNELRLQITRAQKLGDNVPADVSPAHLTPEQTAELDRAAVADDRAAERGRQLVERMNRLAIEKEAAVQAKLEAAVRKEAESAAKRQQALRAATASEQQNELNRRADDLAAEARQMREAADDMKREADALRDATTVGNAEQFKEQLRAAARLTRQNQLSRAATEQKAAAGNLERMLHALEEQQGEEADRLARRLRDAQKQIDDLLDQQELLQKKTEAAAARPGTQERRNELDKLAREQERLERQARDLAQKLSRNRGERAADELRRAARDMARAREQLDNGEPADDAMLDALERLDETQAEVDQARQQNEEELRREQSAKSADEIRALRDRMQRSRDEAARIHGVVQKAGKWERPVRTSLNDLRRQQQGLAGEVNELVRKKFSGAAVFGRMLEQAAAAMELAARRMENRLDTAEIGPFDRDLEQIADAGIRRQQDLALKRLDQLIEALKPEKPSDAPAPAPAGEMPPDMPPDKPAGDQLPPLAQLKALRALQADIVERTATFDQAHPDRSQLNDDEVAELESLQKMQLDVADLIKQLTQMSGM